MQIHNPKHWSVLAHEILDTPAGCKIAIFMTDKFFKRFANEAPLMSSSDPVFYGVPIILIQDSSPLACFTHTYKEEDTELFIYAASSLERLN